MKIVMFSKSVKDKSIEELIALGHDLGIEGYDLCVRPGYPINPDNAGTQLVEAVRTFQQDGLSIPMVTGNFDLLLPDHPTAEPILAAMDAADVRLIKLGYFNFNPFEQDYWQEVDRVRKAFEGWARLAEKYNVRICYHTHSRGRMGLNAAMLSHLVRGFDPRYIGAYLDPCHLVIEGEEFELGAAIMKDYFCILGLKDALLAREEKHGHGAVAIKWVEAGQGMVNWTGVFSELVRIAFDGPMSIHCEFEIPEDGYMAAVRREVAFFNRVREAATS